MSKVAGSKQPRVRRGGGERGNATVWVLALCLVVWGVALAGTAVGTALVARHRAESAADLAALAAARATAAGAGDACAQARRVADTSQARLVGCLPAADGSVLVVAQVAMPGPLAHWADMPPARARARAGGLWSWDGGRARSDPLREAPDGDP